MTKKNITDNADISLWIYNIESKIISQRFQGLGFFDHSEKKDHKPEELIIEGDILEEDIEEYRRIYREIDGGAKQSECIIRAINNKTGKFEWNHVFLNRQPDIEGISPTAIGCSVNIELQKEAQVRYERELNLRQELIKDAVVYYRINLSGRKVEEVYSTFFDTSNIKMPMDIDTFYETGIFNNIYEEDKELFFRMLNIENMLSNYYSGKRTETFLYRRNMPDKGLQWLKGSIAKLKRVSSDDVIAFFTAIDVDDEKKEQLILRDIMDEEIESVIAVKTDSKRVKIVMENKDNLNKYKLYDLPSNYFPLTKNFRDSLFIGMVEEDKKATSEFIETERLREKLNADQVSQITYRMINDDGSIRRKKVRAFFLDETKEDIIFIRRDITDLYDEEQRQKAILQKAIDQADEANRAKSDFLSRMSHDMRTPLNAIIGYSGEFLREDATEKQKDEFLDDINASGKYLLGLINDVLDMTKIESKKMVLHPEAYTVSEFKKNIEVVITPLCEKKGVNFYMETLKESGNDAYLIDKVRFNQIFINILSNSVKFTPPGGKISLIIEDNTEEKDKCEKVFKISDTGCGMSEEFLPHAFESFAQEYEGQRMHNEQGTGLGLSIVKELIELMGGKISVTSKLGEGTTFIINIPMVVANKDEIEKETYYPKMGLKGINVLLCEDHPMNAKIAVRLLEREGCNVNVAKNGKEGLEIFEKSKKNEYQIILMDVRMPIMDGIDATLAIRKSNHESATVIPIIAMTANAFKEDKDMCFKAGMDGHIAKPIEPMEMYRTIYSAIGNNSTEK